jgi:hypothetical protein
MSINPTKEIPVRVLKSLAVLAAFVLSSAAFAQNTITMTPSITSGNGTLTIDLTWSTNPALPAGTPCQASAVPATAEWDGPKAGSGSVTGLGPFTADQRLTLMCAFPGDSQVTYSWVPPTQNTNGTSLTDLSGYRIKQTFNATLTNDPTVAAAGETHIDVAAGQTTRTVTGIAQTGTLRAHMFARSGAGTTTDPVRWSTPSNAATKTFTGNVAVTQQVDLIVRSVPNTATGFTAQ